MNPLGRNILGIFLIILGIAGLFLPFLQGILLILLGVTVLRNDNVGEVWHKVKKGVSFYQRKNK